MTQGLISDEEDGDASQATLDIKQPKPKVALIEDPKQSQVCVAGQREVIPTHHPPLPIPIHDCALWPVQHASTEPVPVCFVCVTCVCMYVNVCIVCA